VPVVRSKAPRRIAALCVAASATVLLAAACSSGGDSPDASGGNGGGGNARGNSAFAAYTDCLKKNGVTITLPSGGPRNRPSGEPRTRPSGYPRPSGSAGQRGGGFPGGGGFGKPAGVDDATWQKAQQACASVRPSGGPGGGGFGRGQGNNGANTAYRNCLRDHGVTMGQGGLSTADPTVAKALETCKVLRPTAIPTPTA
jgi:hypothetical protein